MATVHGMYRWSTVCTVETAYRGTDGTPPIRRYTVRRYFEGKIPSYCVPSYRRFSHHSTTVPQYSGGKIPMYRCTDVSTYRGIEPPPPLPRSLYRCTDVPTYRYTVPPPLCLGLCTDVPTYRCTEVPSLRPPASVSVPTYRRTDVPEG
jgi:hypothetical protein